MRRNRNSTVPFIVLMITTLVSLPVIGNGDTETEYYHVAGNKVDQRTFLGWNLFNDACVGCHGAGGTGTAMAPDLTVSVARMSPVEFETKVLQRYLISLPEEEAVSDDRTALRRALIAEINKQQARESGGTVMPKWEHNPIVRERVQDIYRYLKARADGILGAGKPELMRE